MTRFKTIPAMAYLAAALATTSAIAQTSFRFDRAYSQQDGRLQWIELTETAGLDNQHRFTGLTLTVTSHGLGKTFTFPNDLPSSSTAHRHVTLVSTTFANCCMSPAEDAPAVPIDYVLPNGFLPIDGGTLSFGGIDEWTFGPAPVDGYFALERSGAMVKGEAITFSGGALSATNFEGFGLVATEYYNAALDHYFLSAFLSDTEALDSGRIAGWKRTGWWQLVSFAFDHRRASPVTGPWRDVCRYYLPPPSTSHFLSAFPDECAAAAAAHPEYVLESASAFQVSVRGLDRGSCGDGFLTVPAYRLWNGRADSDHRYVTDFDERARMIAAGWIPEGAGDLGIAYCLDAAGKGDPPM